MPRSSPPILFSAILLAFSSPPAPANDFEFAETQRRGQQLLSKTEERIKRRQQVESVPAILAPQIRVNELHYSNPHNPASPVYQYNHHSGQIDRVR